MNVQLFNFHAAGLSVRSSLLTTSNESPEPPGSASSTTLSKSWNRGRCTASFSFCCYAHRCSVCSGAHRASSCTNQSSKDGRDRTKHRSHFPSASGSGSHAKACRSWLALMASETFWWRCFLVALRLLVKFARYYWLVVIYLYHLISLLTRSVGLSATPFGFVCFFLSLRCLRCNISSSFEFVVLGLCLFELGLDFDACSQH